MSNKPDEYYINQTLNGNVNAYAFLIEKYKHMVFTLSIRIVKNREEAEEISQDVFVKAYTNLKSFKGDSKFSTWIYKIVYYASLDVIKRNKKQINSENIDEIYEGDLGVLQDALSYLEEKERKSIIKKSLLKLNEDEQVILTLYYFEEMPLKEISEVVNLSLDNIKVKLFRARKKLATILEHVIEPKTINLK
ncbi:MULTISPECIES: RNA polymerase sigma factor [Flavobacteriaceae]|uniref:RNA polymerase sigma factor n=2 Tax=Flavobacteriaceae TaxID=49546 RepID=A0A4Y8AWR8_9FLAO|nr:MULTISPECIES: RNA polymerase sigma factor [Flavobacteriaceae]TEW76919.1 RNA polymerase sigma factor [Gramella jeungdoensis]GGK59313.1 DNA-directed RNA polymerase sigma-70 factor [Lutibacter litoralis]